MGRYIRVSETLCFDGSGQSMCIDGSGHGHGHGRAPVPSCASRSRSASGGVMPVDAGFAYVHLHR